MGHSKPVWQVVIAVLLFYGFSIAIDAKGLYHWSQRLPASNSVMTLRGVTKANWRAMARLGLEEPEHTLERTFMMAEGAHPLTYPKTYAETEAREQKHAAALAMSARIQALPVAVREEVQALNAAKGPKALVVGDSIMMTVGPVIKKDIADHLDGAALLEAKLATGLARPDIYDWVKEVKTATSVYHYDYVVLMLGTNDSQDFSVNGRVLTYGANDWVKVYNDRLDMLMNAACDGADHGLWVGLPPMHSPAFNRKITRINSWAKKQVERHSCMQYVSLDQVMTDSKGRYASYLKIGDQLEKVRMIDGIHVTARGGILISGLLMNLIEKGSNFLAH